MPYIFSYIFKSQGVTLERVKIETLYIVGSYEGCSPR